MVRVVFSDFDGTMLNYKKDKFSMDSYQLGVLKRLKDEGIKFCIVTGRGRAFFELFPDLLEIVDYVIASNGACIYDVSNKKYIYNKKISDSSLDSLIRYALDNDYMFLLNCLDNGYNCGSFGKGNVYEYNENIDDDCEQFVLSFDKEKYDEVIEFVNNIGDIVINNSGVKPDRIFFDINDKDVSKGNSIKWLCDYLDVSLKNCIAFGDGINDISMFEVVGKSVAVGNGNEEVKRIADVVVESCHEDGMYKYIEKNILK